MPKKQYAPGPYRADSETIYDANGKRLAVIQDERGAPRRSQEEKLQTARLLAASPRLLAVAENALAVFLGDADPDYDLIYSVLQEVYPEGTAPL